MVLRPDRLTLSMPEELKKQARVKAIMIDSNLSEVVRTLLRMWLAGEIELPDGEQTGEDD